MSRRMNIYYNILVGGLAGLIVWFLLSLLPGLETVAVWLRALSKGALVGILIGGGLGIVEGVLDKSRRKAFMGFATGTVAGLFGGGLGLLVGEAALAGVGGGLIGRSLGWLIFGSTVGSSGGLILRSPRKTSYGTLGGAIGGFLGGLSLEILTQTQMAQPKPWMVGIGLVILGACVGALIAGVEEALVKAKLRVVTGVLEGREFNLTKRVTSLGADERCDIYLPRDKAIRPRHAEIRQEQRTFSLYPLAENRVDLNNKVVFRPHVLTHNDQLRLGSTLLLFVTYGTTKR